MITVVGLTKRYGDRLAVDHLTFAVRPGRVTGFLGPNGAGKSTTLRLILGLARPDAGQATVNGRPYRALRRPLHEVGALLEAAAPHPARSARGHLLALAQANGLGRRRVDAVLGLVGLDGVAGEPAGGFSLGMKQRLGVAAALLGDPPVLLLDEPGNGLDPAGVAWLRGLLRGMAAEGRTVFVSSHLMGEMENTADHLVVIGQGRLLADQPLAAFTRGAAAGRVRVRANRPDQQDRLAGLLRAAGARAEVAADGGLTVAGLAAGAIGELAARHGLALCELTPLRATLEEAFMRSTRDTVDYRPRGGHDRGEAMRP